MKRFIATGISTVIGKPRINFIKNADGFITPIKFLIDFTFNQTFGYSFICSFITKITVPSSVSEDGHKYFQPQDIMYFLTRKSSGPSYLNIIEMSQNALHQCGLDAHASNYPEFLSYNGL